MCIIFVWILKNGFDARLRRHSNVRCHTYSLYYWHHAVNYRHYLELYDTKHGSLLLIVSYKYKMLSHHFLVNRGPGYSRRYSELLRAAYFRDRILLGTKFFAPFLTCPGDHPASCTMGTGCLSPGLKLPGRGFDTHPHLVLRLRKE